MGRKSVTVSAAVVAMAAIGVESAVGGGPYPVAIEIQKAKPTKVKGTLEGQRNPCTNRVPVRIIGKGKVQAKGATNGFEVFRIKPDPALKPGRRYKVVVQATRNAKGEIRCERAVKQFKVDG